MAEIKVRVAIWPLTTEVVGRITFTRWNQLPDAGIMVYSSIIVHLDPT